MYTYNRRLKHRDSGYECRYIFDLESYCKHENQTARGGATERKVCPTAIHGFPTFDNRDDRTYY